MKLSSMYGDDLTTIEWYGALETPEGTERLAKIAVISAEHVFGEPKVARRHLPLFPVRRWRKSLDDVAEASALLASSGGWLARRALDKCHRRLVAAEANLDGYLDKIIHQYGLEQACADFESMSDEDWEEIDRLFTHE